MANLDRAGLLLNINNVPNGDFFFHEGLVDTWVHSELFCPFYSFQADDDVRDRLSVPAQGVFRLRWRELRYLSFKDLFCLLYPEP